MEECDVCGQEMRLVFDDITTQERLWKCDNCGNREVEKYHGETDSSNQG